MNVISDIVFICASCTKRLAIDPKAVGRDIRCPDCDEIVHISRPSLFFQCDSCKAGLYAAAELAGEAVDCPTCLQPMSIPAESQIFCWNCAARLVMDQGTFDALAGSPTRCPQCGSSIDVPELPKQP
jgi:DNA-directed RNA polymerase subunit RPC12/RpoP